VSDQPAETVNRLFLAGAARRAHRIAATVLQPPPEVDFNAYIRALAVLVQLSFLRIVHKGGRRPGDARLFRFHKGGPSMQPRLVISTPSSTIDIDLMRVVEALKSRLSIRKASKALGMDKSKIVRLKRRAEVLKLIGVSRHLALKYLILGWDAERKCFNKRLTRVSQLGGP
jgi:hypothetical protein